jgi:bacteriocin biosynthesis cyclodehydratase domain-containing protein
MDSQALLPQLKPTSPVYGTPQLIQIEDHGQIVEIEDESGRIRRFLELLTGTRTVDQVWQELRCSFPDTTLEDVTAAIDQFDQAGFLLNGAHGPDGILNEYEQDRWQRNINFFGAYSSISQNKYELQGRLRDCRITLLGLGGLGSHLLLDLAAMGIGHIRAIEFDRVELSNLNRQILYRDRDVGKEKLNLAVSRVRDFNPSIDIEPVQIQLSSTADVLRVAEGADLLISAADRPKTQIINWVNAACVQLGVPLVSGGLDTQYSHHITVLPGQTGCIECWRLQVAATDTASTRLLQQKRELQITGDRAAFAPLVTMTTGFILGEVTRIITGIAPPIAAGRLMRLRFDDFELAEYERWSKRSDCPVCGSSEVPAEPVLVATAPTA